MNDRPDPLCPPAPEFRKGCSIVQCLHVFKHLLQQTHIKLEIEKEGVYFYDRLFTPAVTLWCMIFQRLNHDHTLQAAVCDLHSGGADRFASKKGRPPSKVIRTLATAAFSKARKRSPLTLFAAVLLAQAKHVWSELRGGRWHGLRVLLLDGSQISLRPHPGISEHFTSFSNQNGRGYWVPMRVVATFCLHTGIVVASAADSTLVSEQALARRQILKDLAGCLYLGDRNFGVFQMVQCVLQAHAHCLFRMTASRAGKVAGSSGLLLRPGDYRVSWRPSRDDLKVDGCRKEAISGRLIVAQYARPGFRPRWIYLFTTLLDASAHTAEELVELYGERWHVELDLRYLKTQMDLNQLDCKTKDMAEKEWLAGLMAYNLVRVVMAAAATAKGLSPSKLSFSAARRLLVRWLLTASPKTSLLSRWRKLLKSVARARLPSRKKQRPPEPRAKRHKGETFPPLRGSRSVARENVRISNMKS
jgi:hypothetical protein